MNWFTNSKKKIILFQPSWPMYTLQYNILCKVMDKFQRQCMISSVFYSNDYNDETFHPVKPLSVAIDDVTAVS